MPPSRSAGANAHQQNPPILQPAVAQRSLLQSILCFSTGDIYFSRQNDATVPSVGGMRGLGWAGWLQSLSSPGKLQREDSEAFPWLKSVPIAVFRMLRPPHRPHHRTGDPAALLPGPFPLFLQQTPQVPSPPLWKWFFSPLRFGDLGDSTSLMSRMEQQDAVTPGCVRLPRRGAGAHRRPSCLPMGCGWRLCPGSRWGARPVGTRASRYLRHCQASFSHAASAPGLPAASHPPYLLAARD